MINDETRPAAQPAKVAFLVFVKFSGKKLFAALNTRYELRK
jgi:hypothetical protein